MPTREEEMAKMRERYARLQKGDAPIEKPKEKEKAPIVIINKKSLFNAKPYLFLIENDIRKLFRLPQKEWKIGGLKFEQINKPLDLEWLKKKDNKF
jgi:hypothetical protein